MKVGYLGRDENLLKYVDKYYELKFFKDIHTLFDFLEYIDILLLDELFVTEVDVWKIKNVFKGKIILCGSNINLNIPMDDFVLLPLRDDELNMRICLLVREMKEYKMNPIGQEEILCTYSLSTLNKLVALSLDLDDKNHYLFSYGIKNLEWVLKFQILTNKDTVDYSFCDYFLRLTNQVLNFNANKEVILQEDKDFTLSKLGNRANLFTSCLSLLMRLYELQEEETAFNIKIENNKVTIKTPPYNISKDNVFYNIFRKLIEKNKLIFQDYELILTLNT
jgi:hypothetical protein